MAQIQNAIPKQSFELIRDRIGEILADEIASQVALINDPDQLEETTVWVERIVDFDLSELPSINVMLFKGEYNEKNIQNSRGVYDYMIDFHLSAGSVNGGERGDVLAQVRIQRLVGVVRAILESPFYIRLGFDTQPAIIERVKVVSVQIGEQKSDKDGANVSSARMMFQVASCEATEGIQPRDAEGYDTTVTLEETPQGFRYQVDNP